MAFGAPAPKAAAFARAVVAPTTLVKLTVAPGLRARPMSRVADWPAPLAAAIVELPLFRVTVPSVWLEEVVALPRKLRVPPLSAIPVELPMRAPLFAAE